MLASDIKDRFQRDGFVFPIDVMDSAAAAAYRARLEAAETAFPDLVNAKTCLRRYPNLVLPFVDEISRLPAVTDAHTHARLHSSCSTARTSEGGSAR